MPYGNNGGLAIEVELRAERASAMRRVAERLESLIQQMLDVRGQYQAASPGVKGKLRAAYRELRSQAEKQLWYLIVQREAMGLRLHHDAYEMYAIPPSLPES